MKISILIYVLIFAGIQNTKAAEGECVKTFDNAPLDGHKIAFITELQEKINPDPSTPFLLSIKSQGTANKWKNEYSNFLYQTLSTPAFDSLLAQEINQEDLKKLNCPNLNQQNNENKKKFYITYLAAIAEASSSFNPKEKSYASYDQTTNYGLLQIDTKAAKRHTDKLIGSQINENQLMTYQQNLQVGSYILKHQIAGEIATGRLFPPTTYYWPVLKNAQKKILKTFELNSSNLSFCQSEIAKESAEETPPKAIVVIEETPPKAIVVIEETPPKAIIVLEAAAPKANIVLEAAPPVVGDVSKKAPLKAIAVAEKISTSETKPKLNVTAFSNRLKSLPIHSGGMCAKGVRQNLNVLFGGSVYSGPPAKEYSEDFLSNWHKGNSCYKKSTADSSGDFENYDIRVLEPKDPAKFGHIEVYFEGKWYSDFKQRMSLWNNGNSSYKKKRFYRLTDCSRDSTSSENK